MNVNSGGPHLLLFERDQQLTALLTSEFQLAGYECHAARTAVEVFDAIARYPIRLVLVNLAQAAAGRREFWVALDAQRRGRGVQVFTFRCMNLAGYGPDDPDERGRTVLADMEVDGRPGVMNLVDAIRARIPGTTTGSNPRLSATSGVSRQVGAREVASADAKGLIGAPLTAPTGQTTSPMPTLVSNGISAPSAPSSQPVSSPTLQRPQSSAPRLPVPQTEMPTSSMLASSTMVPSSPSLSPSPTVSPSPAGSGNTPSGFTDKIRAVIYPSDRNFSQIPAGQEAGEDQINGQNSQNQSPANSSRNETGLEQLSRMIREQTPPAQEEEVHRDLGTQLDPPNSSFVPQPSTMDAMSNGQMTQGLMDSPPISAMSLRASPIQDITIEREYNESASGATNRQTVSRKVEPPVEARLSVPTSQVPTDSFSPVATDAPSRTHSAAFVSPSTPALPPASVSTMSSLNSLSIPLPTEVSTPDSPAPSKPASTPVPASIPTSAQALGSTSELMSTPTPTAIEPEHGDVRLPLADAHKDEPSLPFTEDKPNNGLAPVGASMEAQWESVLNPSEPAQVYRSEENSIDRTLVESPLADALKASVKSVIRRNETGTSVSTDETLLNIVQSFPPMPAPAQSPQQAQQSQRPVLSGRATRSLGSVLLEGHLVPQHRLEVAQHIQRMLRGVDMNYQLGEILLMFKLLTPDQLLAASLVSYGLISTMQISALGRIRQELHAIGLEYDLESLLVLFRILSPEQLREVRASWSG